MTAKEKAKDLFYKFRPLAYKDEREVGSCKIIKEMEIAKQCALLAVKEILETIPYINNTQEECNKRLYYIEVSEEISKL
jgi:hypothetical protein